VKVANLQVNAGLGAAEETPRGQEREHQPEADDDHPEKVWVHVNFPPDHH
jgi:hypothetical protein